MREASFALMEAKYSAGEFRHTVFDAVEQVLHLFPRLWVAMCKGSGYH